MREPDGTLDNYDIAKAEFEICQSEASSPTKTLLKRSTRGVSRTNEKKKTSKASFAAKKEP